MFSFNFTAMKSPFKNTCFIDIWNKGAWLRIMVLPKRRVGQLCIIILNSDHVYQNKTFFINSRFDQPDMNSVSAGCHIKIICNCYHVFYAATSAFVIVIRLTFRCDVSIIDGEFPPLHFQAWRHNRPVPWSFVPQLALSNGLRYQLGS